MALPIVALAAMAAQLLTQGKKDEEARKARAAEIEQNRLKNLSLLYQGGRAAGGYETRLPPQDKSDNGLASAIQLAGGVASGLGGGEQGAGGGQSDALMGAIDKLGSDTNRLEAPKLIEEQWHPISDDSSIGDPDQWKSGVTLIGDDDPEDKWKRGIRL